MKNFILRQVELFHRIRYRFIKFLLVGLLNTVFGLSVYWILVYFGVHFTVAAFISTVLGILFNFKTYGSLVFRDKNNKLIFRFFLVYGITYLTGIGMIKLLLMAGIDKYTAGAIVTIPNAVISYFLNRQFVFNKPG